MGESDNKGLNEDDDSHPSHFSDVFIRIYRWRVFYYDKNTLKYVNLAVCISGGSLSSISMG